MKFQHVNLPLAAKSGFSLVELSIVLVILGLLVGGVLTGQSLIRAAELRSVTTEYEKYAAAVHTFRDKYFALPGDMTNATSFWGAADPTPATCLTTASTTTATCNGDGDGDVSVSAGSYEGFRFWQHLANAGLIEGQYDGITHGTMTWSASVENVPKAKLSNSYWMMWNWGTLTTNAAMFDGVYENSLQIGALFTNSTPRNPVFRPEEVWNIDTKVDDGKPGLGKVVVLVRTTGAPSGFPSCTTGATNDDINSDYLLTSTDIACALVFRQVY